MFRDHFGKCLLAALLVIKTMLLGGQELNQRVEPQGKTHNSPGIHPQPSCRARSLGIPLEGIPGPLNVITDVKGVEVGQVTLIAGNGKLEVGKSPVRTGVTAILPSGKTYKPSLLPLSKQQKKPS